MKRNSLITMILLFATSHILAQEITTTGNVSEIDIKARDCTTAPLTHWSLGIKTGANYFRVATQPIKRMNQIHMIVGGTVEYSFSPLVGMGLEFIHNPFSRNYSILPDKDSIAGSFKGASNDLILYGSMNLANLLNPYRLSNSQKLNVFLNAGVGYCLYKNSLDMIDPNEYDMSPLATLGVNIEYNVSNSIALGLEGKYNQYHRKLINGNSSEKSNALNLSIGLRYKINSTENKQHARNISMCDYYPRPEPLIIEKTSKCDTVGAMIQLKIMKNEIDALNDKINKLTENKTALTSKEKGDSYIQAQKTEEEIASYDNIEFEFNSAKLQDSSSPTLDKIAAVLTNNPHSLKIGVIGYTDYIGTEKYNQDLSIRRANAVRLYLLNKEVPATNIYIIGCGKRNPIAPNETKTGRQKNRRVEFKVIM